MVMMALMILATGQVGGSNIDVHLASVISQSHLIAWLGCGNALPYVKLASKFACPAKFDVEMQGQYACMQSAAQEV